MSSIVFAYGSNMHLGQLTSRCPTAKVIGTATLRGWGLAFVGWSERWQGGVATIERGRAKRTEGIAFEVSQKDLERLDRYEGVPSVYERRTESIDVDGARVRAFVYWRDRADRTAPSYQYFSTILAGAIMNGVPTARIIDAAEEARGPVIL